MPLPPPQGLYDPAREHDACGLGFVATLQRRASHDIVLSALEILGNLTHRGAAGCDPCTGDGAGVLLQIPHELYASERLARGGGETLPERGDYGVAMCFLARDPARRRRQEAILEGAVLHHGQRVLGWRDVPLWEAAIPGPTAWAPPTGRGRGRSCRSSSCPVHPMLAVRTTRGRPGPWSSARRPRTRRGASGTSES